MKILMENEFGSKKVVKIGFSWTVFFFGSLVPLFRADWKWFFIMLIASPLTFGLSHFLFLFKYNEWYLDDLKNKGYKEVKSGV